METALQELLKYVKGMPNQQAYAEEINCIKERIKQLLPKEREQIEGSWEAGNYVAKYRLENETQYQSTSEEYYETNFNTNKV